MVLKKSVTAVVTIVQQFFTDILNVNWNDQLLSEFGSAHAKRYEFHAEDSEF